MTTIYFIIHNGLNKLKRKGILLYFLLPILISVFLYWPFLTYEYKYSFSELRIYMSFLKHFVDKLQTGIFLVWNQQVGMGMNAVTWSHIPINQYTPFILLVGFSEHFHLVLRCFDFIFLLYGFILLGRLYKANLFFIIACALVYFTSHRVYVWFSYGIQNNIYCAFPFVFYYIQKYFLDSNKKYLLAASLFFYLSFLGSKIEFIFLNTSFFMFFFGLQVFLKLRLKYKQQFFLLELKTYFKAFVLFIIIPIIANSWSLYLLISSFQASGRNANGLILGIFNLQTWREFYASFVYNNYIYLIFYFLFFWGLYKSIKFFLYKTSTQKYRVKNRFRRISHHSLILLIFSFFIFASFSLFNHVFIEKSKNIFGNLIYLLNSSSFLCAFILWLVLLFFHVVYRYPIKASGFFRILIMICLLSTYFYDETNVDNYITYFQEFNVVFKSFFIFILGVVVYKYFQIKSVQFIFYGLIFNYLMRTHFQILLLRIFGINWHYSRDSFIYCFLFSTLFLIGINKFSKFFKNNVKYAFIILLLVYLIPHTKGMMYNTYIGNVINKSNIVEVLDYSDKIKYMKNNLDISREEGKIERILSLNPNLTVIGGQLQDTGFYQADIYESFKPKLYDDIIRIFTDDYLLADDRSIESSLPDLWYPSNIYKALNTSWQKIAPEYVKKLWIDIKLPINKNLLKFLKVKYILAPTLLPIDGYECVKSFPDLPGYASLHLFKNNTLNNNRFLVSNNIYFYKDNRDLVNKLTKNGNYDPDNDILLSEKDRDYFQKNFSRNCALDYNVSKVKFSDHKILFDIELNFDAILKLFDLWDPHWKVKVNGENKKLLRVDHALRGVLLNKGKNHVEFYYNNNILLVFVIISIGSFLYLLYMAFCHFFGTKISRVKNMRKCYLEPKRF